MPDEIPSVPPGTGRGNAPLIAGNTSNNGTEQLKTALRGIVDLHEPQRSAPPRHPRVANPNGTPNHKPMSDNVYRVTEVVGSSTKGVEDAIRKAVDRAAQTLRHVDWFEVTEIRGHVEHNELSHYQVGLKIGFRLETQDERPTTTP
ncbi:hypothetical protein GCM10011581_19410 [Saccharopolyspora subtropica]|uniref:Dodecin domain-containing protein n=2 Tax=Saccharopolyspora thermophila TaxID=89367 RepID=A0A917JSS3_9PSEU|nr:hypothetical protein GCM10011581_19410 [Saccharopolyspora subtropica]